MAGDSSTRVLAGWKVRVLSHLRSGQVSKIVYGSIIGLALVLTLQAHPPSAAVVIGSLVATGFAVALAELYSEVIGARTQESLGEEHESIGMIVEDAASVVVGVSFPAVFFVLSAVGLWTMDTAFALAKWTGLGLIAGYGYLAARLSGASVPRGLLQASGVAVIAALLIAFKAILH
jgi:hypothetical protein